MRDEQQLLSLAERCVQATGPDWCIDHDIVALLDPDLQANWALAENARVLADDAAGMAVKSNPYSLPRYTASLDAAMTLVPEGWQCLIAINEHATVSKLGKAFRSEAATTPLALCAAALRARAAVETDNG